MSGRPYRGTSEQIQNRVSSKRFLRSLRSPSGHYTELLPNMPFRTTIGLRVEHPPRGIPGKLQISVWQTRFWRKTIVHLRTIKSKTENNNQTNRFHEKHT